MKDGDAVWLLDEGGREFRSIEFAAFLDRQHSSGARRLVFVVGGPMGSLRPSMRAPTAKFRSRASPFPTNGALVFHRATVSRYDDPPRRTLSPRMIPRRISFRR